MIVQNEQRPKGWDGFAWIRYLIRVHYAAPWRTWERS